MFQYLPNIVVSYILASIRIFHGLITKHAMCSCTVVPYRIFYKPKRRYVEQSPFETISQKRKYTQDDSFSRIVLSIPNYFLGCWEGGGRRERSTKKIRSKSCIASRSFRLSSLMKTQNVIALAQFLLFRREGCSLLLVGSFLLKKKKSETKISCFNILSLLDPFGP